MTEEEKKAAEEAAAKEAAEKKAADDAKAKEAADKKAAEDSETAEELRARLKKVEDEKAELLKESMGRKDKFKAKESEMEELRKKFEGIDPEAAREALAAKADAQRKEMESKGEYDKILAQVNEANDKKIADKDAEISTRDERIAKLEATVNRLTIGNYFSSSEFINEQLVLTPNKVEALYGTHFDVEDGAMVAYDQPRGSSERTKLVDDKGAPLGFEAAITKIVSADPDFERMQKSKLKPGAQSKEGEGKDKTADTPAASGLARISAALSARK